MKVIAVLGGQPTLELDDAGLTAGSDVDLIRHIAETARANFYGTCSL